jgi:cysteine-rich repeat protein
MSFAVLRNRWVGRWLPGMAALVVLVWGGCTLDFPVEWLEGECGDGYVGQGEQCDDGDTNSGDGCSATCTEEAGFDCDGVPSVCVSTCGDNEVASDEQCDDGNTVSGDGCDEFCNTEIVGCGDGEILSADGEECDDSNTTAFDGCSDQCLEEAGWNCTGAPSVCTEICGDGLVVGAEAVSGGCDDGNQDDGDGCNFLCQSEPGYVCNGEPSVCQDICGDGAVAPGLEDCDDGNIVSADGCSPSCGVEDGFTCDGASPTVCAAICGDGTVLGAEAQAGGCDDGNTDPDDGCAADCTEEAGYVCSGEPSVCTSSCGDNVVMGTEVCDDGNTDDCDGCRGDCSADETGCGDGFVCEGCDDGNTESLDGCSASCTVEAGWTCAGEPSVCTVTCSRPEALYLQSGCNAGEMCVVSGYSGGTYSCENEGASAFYQSCASYLSCVAGAACDNLGAGQQCLPYCNANDPSWTCPMNGSENAACLIFYPDGSDTNAVCVSNECDAVAQTGCTGDWCDRLGDGVSICNSNPPGEVTLHQPCVQTNPVGPSEECLPGLLCINTGTDECLALCRHTESDCTVGGESCHSWTANDPIYGVCQ